MANGRKTGGRRKGSANKKTLEVQHKLAALGCDPIAGMAQIAMNRKNSAELRGRMFSELAQYIAPKRKAIEHTGEEGAAMRIIVETGVPPRAD